MLSLALGWIAHDDSTHGWSATFFFFNNDDSGPFGAGQLECTQWGWLNFGSTKKAADATKFASSLLP